MGIKWGKIMARIRTIKPEFWQDEELSSVSAETALLAIGLLNISDDSGYFKAHHGLIQAAIFPLRDTSVSAHEMLIELSNIDYIELFLGTDHKSYGLVNGFTQHQKINRPTPSKIKELYKLSDNSVSDHEQLTAGKERKGKERRGKEPDGEKHSAGDISISKEIFSLIQQMNPGHKEPNYASWADTIRLMRERDNRTHNEIIEMFGFANSHDFWRKNILGPEKLRKQWDKLSIERNGSVDQSKIPEWVLREG